MTESVNTSTGRSANITKPHTIKTGMNINWNLLLKQRPPIKDHKNNSCLLVQLMFPMDKNLFSGEFGKISKYKDLEIEIERMWHLKPTLIPAVVGVQ